MNSNRTKKTVLLDKSDPFLRLLSKMPLPVVALSAFLFHFLILGVIAFFEGTLFAGELSLPLAYNMGWSVTGGIAMPITWVTFVYFHRRIPEILDELYKTKVLRIGRERYLALLSFCQSQFHQSWHSILAICISVTVLSFFFYTTFTDGLSTHNAIYEGKLPERPTISAIVNIPQAILGLYLIFLFYLKLISLARVFFYLAKLKRRGAKSVVYINPFHPDECGGLLIIGKLAYLLVVPAVTVGLVIFSTHQPLIVFLDRDVASWPLVLSIAAYILIAWSTIILPLLPFSRLMRKAKHTAYVKNAEQFTKLRDVVHYEYSTEQINIIYSLRKLRNTIRQFPIWPYDRATLKRVAGILSIPFGILFPLIQNQLFSIIRNIIDSFG